MSCDSVMDSGHIFNIQRYSLNDGEGIRTVVFFKGCPLKCPWCANPESRSLKSHTIKREAKCIHCDHCDMDVEECPTGAVEIVGKDMTLEEVLSAIAKDDVFYRTSGGGVTLSGGEILSQAPFVIKLLTKLRQLGYHTAIETSGQGSTSQLLKIGQLCDEVLFDFKIMDAELARQVTGINLQRVLDNFRQLTEQGVKVIPRLPLIPGYTLNIINVDKVLNFIAPFGLKEVHLLPFHQYGASKYQTLNMEYAMKEVAVPAKDEIASVRRHVEAHGYNVIIGG
ncbi:[formate-C-acetyltransferase]-activating enzyme [Vibrio sp. SCSIO 43137]|uniref:[formate-C-acetyltransferase]-activating enzyme n=1 Tax=Vibrio sp. SCSIO 43137 TaxID=3021011 RepID=UPI0023082EC1|nr:[formate-C-acetyltransferase]-activating enzyme [Vibrio sp. SCSIO 43137]WCE32114.1 [formate-C-acetyltransferase]-activating enzyme [Vibrio sp. SCSIO 43137]